MNIDKVSGLTTREILQIARKTITIPLSIANHRKSAILQYINQQGNDNVYDDLHTAWAAKTSMKRNRSRAESLQEDLGCGSQRRRIEEFGACLLRDQYNNENFLDLPTWSEVKECYQRFYAATGNNAIRMVVCAVCAREIGQVEEEVSVLNLAHLPNAHRLCPTLLHPAQADDLFDGKLLERAGVTVDGEGATQLNVCQTCLRSLSKQTPDKPPTYSLANDLWIGRVPPELSLLTFPEQLLISHIYPRVYVFKLFPKVSTGIDPSKLQRAMGGTVTTFDLDITGTVSMLEGDLMPRPPSVLASLISVTFIGVQSGKLSKRWLRQFFRVRRHMVHAALCWLKKNNTKYYGEINIDPKRLSMLPNDDIPPEVMAIVRQSTDKGMIEQESEGYAPSSILENHDLDEAGDKFDMDDDPDVIPSLYINGAMDTNLSNLSAEELINWGMLNLWSGGGEGSYAVRHGTKPVNDFGRPRHGDPVDPHRLNFFERAYPVLFPYGCGGIERDQPVPISFIDHVRWALQYHDRRFRRHETFPFVSFGIQQRRQALLSARLQMRRPNFEKEAQKFSLITMSKLKQAADDEARGLLVTDPAIRLLQKNVYSMVAKVQGSNQSRIQLRSQIWSTCLKKNPPSLWITINPSDLHDPIAQVFAGEKIDLDKFVSTMGPDLDQRSRNIAADPYAAAKFFHFTIRTILETLFGIKVTTFQVKNRTGIFGRVSAYFGTVESQGRATLHLHLIVWLENAPSSDKMNEMLSTQDFRIKVSEYIQANLRAYLPGLDSKETIQAIPREKEISFNRPPNPDSMTYDNDLAEFELRLARTEQIHICKVRRCLVPDKDGVYRCKRRAPFEISESDKIDEKGNWHQRRLYGYVNGWVPGILVNARCNNDGKLITNGQDTKGTSAYLTLYAAKKQGQNYNASAIMAKGFAYHLDNLSTRVSSSYLDSIRDSQRLLLFRLVHALNREQELAGPMVISYLMGWEDTYRSHHYSPIYWSSFVQCLIKEFPQLQSMKSKK